MIISLKRHGHSHCVARWGFVGQAAEEIVLGIGYWVLGKKWVNGCGRSTRSHQPRRGKLVYKTLPQPNIC
ncbi:MAG: hypothetical protein KKF80_03400, partial [Candidatus Omnitrophica bacterium]|nr:hypothetical protein [Candidatus Omnitrophota bacterium]